MKNFKIYEKGAESWDYYVVSFASREDFIRWFIFYRREHSKAVFEEVE